MKSMNKNMIFLKKPDPIDSREIDCLIYEELNGGTVARRSDGFNTLSANIS